MPPRKRKQPPKGALAAITEDETRANDAKQSVLDASPDDSVKQLLQQTTKEVDERAHELVALAQERAKSMRKDYETQLLKLPKSLHNTTVAQLFCMSADEASAKSISDLYNLVDALHLQQQQPQQQHDTSSAPIAAPACVPSAAAPVGDEPSTSVAAKLCTGGKQPLAVANVQQRTLPAGQVVYTLNGSPIMLHTGAVALPVEKESLVQETPALPMTRAAAAAQQLQTAGFTGHTFRRATVARGRTKQASRAITITVADGKSFVVDDMLGLANVPQKYHEEVVRILQTDMQDLNALAAMALKGRA